MGTVSSDKTPVTPNLGMKGLLSLLSTTLGLGTIQKVSLRPSECNNCGMTSLGQLNLKICGGSLPEVCCSIVNIANFENVNTIDQFQLTVYHEGSDGGQLDYVEVATSD